MKTRVSREPGRTKGADQSREPGRTKGADQSREPGRTKGADQSREPGRTKGAGRAGRKEPKALHVFVITAVIAELLITAAVLGLYYLINPFRAYFEQIYLSTLSVTILLITVVACVATYQVGKKIMKPLTKMREAAQAVIHGDYSVRLSEHGRIQEISEIACDFNIMVRELGNTEMLREDFIANVSHEFKTPLSVIEGYITLLQGDVTPQEKQEYIDTILYNTKRLGSLTSNILFLSKLKNREIHLEKETFQLDKQICDVMVDFDEQWEKKGIEIAMDMEEVQYHGYRTLLPQVWSNLIQNAIKFTNSGGALQIACHQLGSVVSISFLDSGIGMSEEMQEHIFDKFYQGEHSRSTEGNGLGLSLVKQITELCGGSIQVTSEPGKGSCFTVCLPLNTEKNLNLM